MEALNKSRRELELALGQSAKEYFHNLKLWFLVKISKELFDVKSRKLLPAHQIHLHNNFLLALLNKCQISDSIAEQADASTESIREKVKQIKHQTKLSSRKRPRPPSPFSHRYEPADPSSFVSPSIPVRLGPPPVVPPAAPLDPAAQLVVRQRVLPDKPLVHGRMFLEAWQLGLDGVTGGAVDIVMVALHQCLKNVLSAVLSRKSGYQVRNDRVIHRVGQPVPNPWLRTTTRLLATRHNRSDDTSADCDDDERTRMLRTACSSQQDKPIGTVTLWHVMHALQLQPSALPCQLLHNQLAERVSARLSHPDGGTLQQEDVARQMSSLRHQMRRGSTAVW